MQVFGNTGEGFSISFFFVLPKITCTVQRYKLFLYMQTVYIFNILLTYNPR